MGTNTAASGNNNHIVRGETMPGVRDTDRHLHVEPLVWDSWKSRQASKAARVVLSTTDPIDIVQALGHDVGGVVRGPEEVDIAVRAITLGIRIRAQFEFESLGLTRCEAEIVVLRARGATWINVAEAVGYCERQTRRVFTALMARYQYTEAELLALAQVIALRSSSAGD